MGAQTTLVITHDKDVAGDLKVKFQVPNVSLSRKQASLLENLFADLGSGVRDGSLLCTMDDGDGVAASGTITFSSLANNDTVTVGGVVFTAKTSGASGSAEFNLGANDTAAAVNFIAKVNAHATLAGIVTATSSLGVNTISAAKVGQMGNLIGIAISAHGSVSAALLAGGTNSANSTSINLAYGV